VRIGILTDIHGDYESMARVIDHLERQRVDRLVCLGDLVVHGPHQNEVVDFFRSRPDIPVIKGNHDIGATIHAAELDALRFFSPASRENTEKARATLTPVNKAYLSGLPLDLHMHQASFTHGGMSDPFALLRKPETILATFERMPGSVLFAGHTHRTRVHHWPKDRPLWCTAHPAETGPLEWVLNPEDRYIINIGATAQLKYDFFPPICAIYEPEAHRVSFQELLDLRR
jgi:predicted phosphodiesterase